MKLHNGNVRLATLRFATHVWGRATSAGRETFERWVIHRVRALYGVSFGHRLFIGVMVLSDTREEDERIK